MYIHIELGEDIKLQNNFLFTKFLIFLIIFWLYIYDLFESLRIILFRLKFGFFSLK
jgi:hypothetical protein